MSARYLKAVRVTLLASFVLSLVMAGTAALLGQPIWLFFALQATGLFVVGSAFWIAERRHRNLPKSQAPAKNPPNP